MSVMRSTRFPHTKARSLTPLFDRTRFGRGDMAQAAGTTTRHYSLQSMGYTDENEQARYLERFEDRKIGRLLRGQE